ncbi:hypothetical protein [Vibrio sp. YIC-376]|uniref:hypothetical protein n=1 Tax=Vibrio sp. YIC-376 TaxID=3136162 RepID=UPI00402A7D6B
MRLKPLHTLWLTLFTTLILLVSSVVNSAPLMDLKMMQMQMQNNNMLSAETVVNANEHCGTHSMDMDMSATEHTTSLEMTNGCSDGEGMVHNCCTSACSFVFVSLPVPENQPYQLAYLATISLETVEPILQGSHDLYRPPIV